MLAFHGRKHLYAWLYFVAEITWLWIYNFGVHTIQSLVLYPRHSQFLGATQAAVDQFFTSIPPCLDPSFFVAKHVWATSTLQFQWILITGEFPFPIFKDDKSSGIS